MSLLNPYKDCLATTLKQTGTSTPCQDKKTSTNMVQNTFLQPITLGMFKDLLNQFDVHNHLVRIYIDT